MNQTVKSKCPYCLRVFTLGKDGTVQGCDECLKVLRNVLDGTVIDEVDSMTDMEKA